MRGYGIALAGVAVTVGLGVAAAVGPASWAQSGGYAKTVMPMEEVRASLEAMGYEVLSLELDGDEYEGYALRDGRRWEVELDAATGRLTEAEFDADDDEHDEGEAYHEKGKTHHDEDGAENPSRSMAE